MDENNNEEDNNQSTNMSFNVINLNIDVTSEPDDIDHISQYMIEFLEFIMPINNDQEHDVDRSQESTLDTDTESSHNSEQVSETDPDPNPDSNSDSNPDQHTSDNNMADINSSTSLRRSILEFRNLFNSNERNSILDYFVNPFNAPINYQSRQFDRSLVENLISQTLNQERLYKNVISDEGKKDIKKIIYKPNNSYNTSCPISLVDFEEEQEVTVLPCNHCFFPEAIEKWLQEEKAECPVCRLKLSSKEVKCENLVNHEHVPTDIPANQRNDIFTSFRNRYDYSDMIDHPYGPSRRLNIIPHSYIPTRQEENIDIELAIYLSLHSNDIV